MTTPSPADSRLMTQVHWILRLSCAACFIGHGAFGFITKDEWASYFAVAGIPPMWSLWAMPFVGAWDIFVGLSVLLWPCRAVVAYMTIWGFWTACLRPLTGEGIWELLERAGNYGVPLAFLLSLRAEPGIAGLLEEARPLALDADLVRRLGHVLRWTTATLLLGHGALGLVTQKEMLAELFSAVGLGPSSPMPGMSLVELTGLAEILLAVGVLAAPVGPLLAVVLVWKLFSELLYPLAGIPVWEFVERSGSYAAPLTLYLLGRLR
jgi:hypothetical protein